MAEKKANCIVKYNEARDLVIHTCQTIITFLF